MKNTITKCLLILVVMMPFASCTDDFLETSSTEDVSATNATATTENMNLVINGIYRLFYTRLDNKNGSGNNRKGGIGSMMIQNSFMGEDVVQNAQANSSMIDFARWIKPFDPDDDRQLHNWRVMYRAIVNANIVIAGGDEAVGPEEDKNAALGQAYFLRAFAHFHLVQLYGKRYVAGGGNDQLGIPIVLEPIIEPQARATVEAVYTQINEDLTQAITLLDGYSRFNPSHANQAVAQGLKARVALVQSNFTEAVNMARLARAGLTLMDSSTYTSGFNDYNIDEWMWGLHYNEEQGSNFTNFGGIMSRNFSSNQIRGNPKSISQALYATIPGTDVRSAIFDPTGDHDNLPEGISLISRHKRFPYTHQKFLAVSTGDSRGDIPLMRASEMYLIEAEALARSGTDDAGAAVALFTLASARDASYTLSTNTGQALIDEIDLQRRWELWGEGFRFYDLKRQNKALNRNGSNHDFNLVLVSDVPAGDNRWQWMIPTDELNANPLMVQNP
ncbi:MAG: RagB/SusD family nutrient uptake outer membrane protein [Reichenbachiella sp.]|uniref:RagB/SusD family nutrient uptake outer membrane protein n=1 Tax=Reichenbachiella sp. TaxID=2184521 RepID=UPI003267EC5D